MPDSVYAPYMQMMGMPSQYYPMMEMPQEQLESMYPGSYYMIYPAVQQHCDMAALKYGMMHTPTRRQLEDMVDGIYNQVDPDAGFQQEADDSEDRQLGGFGGFGGFGRRRFFRDIITILLIRELLNRRRPYPYGGYPGYYGGGYGGYPGY